MDINNLRASTIEKSLISPVIVADNTPIIGEVIDTQHATYCDMLLSVGFVAAANPTFTVSVRDGDVVDDVNNPTIITDAEQVPQTFIEGNPNGGTFSATDDNKDYQIGYRPRKRYVSMVITPADNDADVHLSAFGLLSGFSSLPLNRL